MPIFSLPEELSLPEVMDVMFRRFFGEAEITGGPLPLWSKAPSRPEGRAVAGSLTGDSVSGLLMGHGAVIGVSMSSRYIQLRKEQPRKVVLLFTLVVWELLISQAISQE